MGIKSLKGKRGVLGILRATTSPMAKDTGGCGTLWGLSGYYKPQAKDTGVLEGVRVSGGSVRSLEGYGGALRVATGLFDMHLRPIRSM